MRKVCKQCGTVAKPKEVIPGSAFTELVLWVCILIPGLIYTNWRRNNVYEVCRACESREIIGLDTPVGRQLTAHLPPEPVYRGSAAAENFGRSVGRLFAKKKK